MSRQSFVQNLDDNKGMAPGAPFIIKMLFKEHTAMPDKDLMLKVLKKHIGSVECFSFDERMAAFAALDYIAAFKDGKCPVQLMLMPCDSFKGQDIDPFIKSQMWDCKDECERILDECQYQIFATDMMSAALEAQDRACLDAAFVMSLSELFPSCEAFYFVNCGKLLKADDVQNCKDQGCNSYIYFGVNVRFFNVEGKDDMVVDTVGMSTLLLPDLQYHFHNMDPNLVVNHALNMASYILEHDNPIKSGETIDGIDNGQISQDLQWLCQYEDALIQPARAVIDINMGPYASGARE